MTRSFSGQLHIRLSPELHEQLAKESFSSGETMSRLCVEAISMKWVLEKDPRWKRRFEKLLTDISSQEVRFEDQALNLLHRQKKSRPLK